MASNLGRLFSSAMEISKPKLGLPCTRSEFPKLATRLVCYSTQQRHNHQDSSDKRTEPISENEGKIQNDKEHDDEEGDDDGGIDLNKETGEVGGPRGPEPTRFGDWERNGRCYDF